MARLLFTLEVTLTRGAMHEEFVLDNPVISRTIEIRSDQTLNQLHRTIFESFGRWDDCHLSEFNMGSGVLDRGGDRYVLQFIHDGPLEFDETPANGSMERSRLGKLGLRVGQVFWYWYDFGDDWIHRITVFSIGEPAPGVKYPRVVVQVGESPPQYREWGDAEMDEEHECGPGWEAAQPLLGWIPVTSDVEAGATELADGSVVDWRHEALSPEEASLMMNRADAQRYCVTTVRELPDGTTIVSIYAVPGQWLDACVREMIAVGDQTIVGVEVL